MSKAEVSPNEGAVLTDRFVMDYPVEVTKFPEPVDISEVATETADE